MYIKELGGFPAQRARRGGGEQEAAKPSPKDAPRAHPCWGGSDREGAVWNTHPKPTQTPPLRQPHLTSTPLPALQLKARHPSSSQTQHPQFQPHSSTPNPKRGADRPGGACAIRRGLEWGERETERGQLSLPLPHGSSSSQQGTGIAPVGAALQTAWSGNNPGGGIIQEEEE